jgi:Protein of unknown function (DUF2726)
MVFQIEHLTDDKNVQEICTKYWLTKVNGKFIHLVPELEECFGLGPNKVTELVQKNCRAFLKDKPCAQCGKKFLFKNRREYSAKCASHWTRSTRLICDECQSEIDKQANLQSELEAEISRKEKDELMREAFREKVHEKLSDLQFKFLKALATSENFPAAGRKIGISEWNAAGIMNDLNDLNLINYDVRNRSYYFLNDLKSFLQKLELKREVKSIFGSPKALECFRLLKEKHQFVFPEIPLCAFIEKSQISHLFTKKLGDWETASPRFKYFLTARVDFLVCDSEGKPQIAYEYQGSYHKDTDQFKKDEFKRLVLKEVGLPLEEITHEDLQSTQ